MKNLNYVFGIEQTFEETARAYLGPDAEMRVGDELGSLVFSLMRLQEDVQHAHSHAGERDEVGECLPHASCGGGTTTQLRTRAGPAQVSPTPPPKPQAKVTVPPRIAGLGLRPDPPTTAPVPEPSSPWAPLDIGRPICGR